MVEDFVNESIKTDVIALIEKLLVAIGVSYEPDVMFDLTSVADSPPPPKANPTDTASAVQALCELVEGAPQNPIEIDCPAPESCIDDTDVVEAPQNPIAIDCPAPESCIDDTDVAEAAQILFAASQRKKMDSNKILQTVRLKNGHCIHSVPRDVSLIVDFLFFLLFLIFLLIFLWLFWRNFFLTWSVILGFGILRYII